MAAKGGILKQEIAEKILATFSGSFLYNDGKEIRINGIENGEKLQIKLTLTCAKTAVEGGDDMILPGEKNVATAAEVGRFVLVEPVPIDVSTPFAAAAANVPTLVVVRFAEPAQVDKAVFSTLPSPILDFVIFIFLTAEPLYEN